MRQEPKLHPAQVSALHALRHASSARFSDLLNTTALTSDVFKFHIRKLVALGYVVKRPDGLYELTSRGKEFTNHLDEATGRTIAQPKASMLLAVRSRDANTTYYLAHCRKREPYRDFWGISSAPLLRGVPIREAAARELEKQTGLIAEFELSALYRVIDVTPDGTVLEDKLFSVLSAYCEGRPPIREWHGGESVWLTREELLTKPKLFPTTARTLDLLDTGEIFAEDTCTYDVSQY